MTVLGFAILCGLLMATVSSQAWTITASANYGGTNGPITPTGIFPVPDGFTTNFTMNPATYCYLSQLTVNGVGVGTQAVYHLPSVQTNIDVVATFLPSLTSRGTPHFWLAYYGLTNGGFETACLEDSDNDGFVNWEEWIASTNPTNAASHLGTASIETLSDGTIRLLWPGKTNRSYSAVVSDSILAYKSKGDENIELRYSLPGNTNELPYDPLTYKPKSDENLPLSYKPSDDGDPLPLSIKGYVPRLAQTNAAQFYRIQVQRLTN